MKNLTVAEQKAMSEADAINRYREAMALALRAIDGHLSGQPSEDEMSEAYDALQEANATLNSRHPE